MLAAWQRDYRMTVQTALGAWRREVPASIRLPSCNGGLTSQTATVRHPSRDCDESPVRAGFSRWPVLTRAARDLGAGNRPGSRETALDRFEKHCHDGRDGSPGSLPMSGGNCWVSPSAATMHGGSDSRRSGPRPTPRCSRRSKWRMRGSRGTYGAPRIHAELAAKGTYIGRKRVAQLMTQAGLAGVSRRRFVTTTAKDGGRQAPDLVERNFTAEPPDQLWVADITYIPTWVGFLYLAVVLDAYSRRIVGWSMATTLAKQLVLDALNMALAARRPRGVIHHSDQGSQYTSIEFGQYCRKAGVRPLMGSVGDAYDNAMCESFFATLECELLARCRFKAQAEVRSAVFAFIEGFYNPRRRHSSIGYLSPIDYERRHHALTLDPDPRQPGVVLATVKDKPCGRPQEGRP